MEKQKQKGQISGELAVDDICIHYVESGAGLPLILLHGNGEESSYFRHQTEYFSKKYRVIAVDTRGHGRSLRGTKPFTIRQFAEDLSGFLEKKGILKAAILGFSDGANIAMCFALKFPEKVSMLILNGGNLNPAGVKRSVQAPIELGYRLASLWAGKSEKARKNAELLGLMVQEPNIDPKDLASIQAPALVIAGTKDMILEEHTRKIAGALPNAELVLIPGDHFIAAKEPEAFNRAVEAFLERKRR